jgi:type IV pilus assembly protein PilW
MTLIELMIGMVIGLVVLGASTTAYLSSMSAQTTNLGLVRLNQDMRAAIDIISRDIRRAGFVTSLPDDYGEFLVDNPFTAGNARLQVHDDGHCILYSYNADDDAPPTVDAAEYFGFRLLGDRVQMRTEGTTNSDCGDGTWLDMTDETIQISDLTFTLIETALNITAMSTDNDGVCDTGEACSTCATGEACLYVQTVDVDIEGTLRDNTDITSAIRNHRIRIRNDRFVESL